jgi:hypothetical protein
MRPAGNFLNASVFVQIIEASVGIGLQRRPKIT